MAEVKSVKTQSAKYIMDEITSLHFSHIPPKKIETYEVKEKDTLSEIAQRYNTTVQKIATLNGIKNPNIIYPEQTLIIPQKESHTDTLRELKATLIPLGAKVFIIAKGTPNKKAIIEVLADELPFKIIKDAEEVSSFAVVFDKNGQSKTEVTLRPKDDAEFKQLINKFSPQVGQSIYTEKVTLRAQMHNPHYEVSLANDDMNTIGLNMYQIYIKSAYIVDSHTGEAKAKLTVQQNGNEIIFNDSKTGEPTAKAPLDKIINAFGNTNNCFGGLAAGLKYVVKENPNGTFSMVSSKGLDFNYYEKGWAGNQYIKTYSMAKWAKGLDRGNFVISIAIGGYQISSAMNKDEAYLDENNISKPDFLPDVGEQTEQQIGSTAAGFGGGVITGRIAAYTLGVLFLPEETGVVLVLGTFIVIGGAVGWILSKLGDKAVEGIQYLMDSTIIHGYPLKDN